MPTNPRARGLHEANTVAAQLKQAEDLLCARTKVKLLPYDIQTPAVWGEPDLPSAKAKDGEPVKGKVSYPACQLKRKIDLVLLSLGGNDVGFSGLVGYSIMKDAGVVAPIAKLAIALTGHKFIFAPLPRYLNFMQHNLGETKRALYEIFAVQPGRVVQTDYEPIPLNEKGKPCTGNLGMEVVDRFKFDKPRVEKVLEFSARFIKSLQCITAPGPDCKEDDRKKATWFNYVDTQAPFLGRGICAVADPRTDPHKDVELKQFVVPRMNEHYEFWPYQPQNYFPYAHRTRLFVSPDDSFMTANTQLGFRGCTVGDLCPPSNDRLQLISRALYGAALPSHRGGACDRRRRRHASGEKHPCGALTIARGARLSAHGRSAAIDSGAVPAGATPRGLYGSAQDPRAAGSQRIRRRRAEGGRFHGCAIGLSRHSRRPRGPVAALGSARPIAVHGHPPGRASFDGQRPRLQPR